MEELKRQNKQLKLIYKLLNALVLIGILMAFIFTLVKPFNSNLDSILKWVGYGFVLIGLILMRQLRTKIKILSNRYKRSYIKSFVESQILDSTFTLDQGIWQTKVLDSAIVNLSDEYKTEDLIEGIDGDLKYSTADIEVFSISRYDGHKTKSRIYMGRFYRFEFPNSFNASVILKPSNRMRYEVYKKYDMPSSDFNNAYHIFTNKESDPTTLLTKKLRTRLLDYKLKYGDHIAFSFIGNTLNIAVETRYSSFDLSPQLELTDTELRKTIDEIKQFIEFAKSINDDITLFNN